MVEIHHVGLPDEESRAGHAEGWSDALAELERHAQAMLGEQPGQP